MRHRFPEKPSGPSALLELDFCEQDGGDPHFYSFGVINQSRYDQEKKSPILECRTLGHRKCAGHLGGSFNVWSCEFTPEDHPFLFRQETDQGVEFLGISPR